MVHYSTLLKVNNSTGTPAFFFSDSGTACVCPIPLPVRVGRKVPDAPFLLRSVALLRFCTLMRGGRCDSGPPSFRKRSTFLSVQPCILLSVPLGSHLASFLTQRDVGKSPLPPPPKLVGYMASPRPPSFFFTIRPFLFPPFPRCINLLAPLSVATGPFLQGYPCKLRKKAIQIFFSPPLPFSLTFLSRFNRIGVSIVLSLPRLCSSRYGLSFCFQLPLFA